MTERELRRLSRTDLLELLLEQRKENEKLRCLLDQAEARLTDRTIQIDNAGSIAEASLQLSERQNIVCQQMEAETKERCDRMVAEAERKSQQYWDICSANIRQLMDSYTGLQQAMDVVSSYNKKSSDIAV